ncbi:GGDEF domain-containing protein [Vibrio hannami]|uniref:sensor domain-containing diguanylate cyclase n=1 Tax=Vibrio hannami TaxID=2717094 RepID=UPI0024108C18|nr:GGDEF domain-containing protein [Vibrio hannami]MDG3085649.1 GGDEF domain-containing protein [Vibrio hannami]
MNNKYQDWQTYFRQKDNPTSVQLGKQTLLEHFWHNTEDHMFVMVLDEDGDFVTEDINPAQTKLLKLPPNKIINQKLRNFMGEELAKSLQAKYMNCLRRNAPISYYEGFLGADGEYRYFNTMLIPITDEADGSKRVFGLARDVTDLSNAQTELEELNRKLEKTVKNRTKKLAQSNVLLQEQAFTDQLTGIGNRRYFFENVERLLENIDSEMDSSLLYLDLDLFKSINDRYGHMVGDKVLIQFAQNLKKTIRTSDILCRFGGEEFVIFLPMTDKYGALQLARKILLSVSKTPLIIEDTAISITTSIGVASAHSQKGSLDSLIINADKALYHAKRNGRNRVEQF